MRLKHIANDIIAAMNGEIRQRESTRQISDIFQLSYKDKEYIAPLILPLQTMKI